MAYRCSSVILFILLLTTIGQAQEVMLNPYRFEAAVIAADSHAVQSSSAVLLASSDSLWIVLPLTVPKNRSFVTMTAYMVDSVATKSGCGMFTYRMVSDDTLLLWRAIQTGCGPIWVEWQVTTDSAFSVQHVVGTILASTKAINVAISAVTLNQTAILLSGASQNATSSPWVMQWPLSTTSIQLSTYASVGSLPITVALQAISSTKFLVYRDTVTANGTADIRRYIGATLSDSSEAIPIGSMKGNYTSGTRGSGNESMKRADTVRIETGTNVVSATWSWQVWKIAGAHCYNVDLAFGTSDVVKTGALPLSVSSLQTTVFANGQFQMGGKTMSGSPMSNYWTGVKLLDPNTLQGTRGDDGSVTHSPKVRALVWD